jgi:RNA polymerase sigma-70 factor, ECF subfamily
VILSTEDVTSYPAMSCVAIARRNCTSSGQNGELALIRGEQTLSKHYRRRLRRRTEGHLVSGQPAKDEFVRRFVRSQQDLYAYILSLVPNTADAQDILQETAIALWGKADEYRLDEPFMPWAARFAWFQVRKFRMYRARRHRRVVALSDDAVAALAAEHSAMTDGSGVSRGSLLDQCMEQLGDDDRLLLRQRYDLRASIRKVAQDRGVEPAQLYKRLARIRQVLVECVDRAFDKQGGQNVG